MILRKYSRWSLIFTQVFSKKKKSIEALNFLSAKIGTPKRVTWAKWTFQ